MPIFQLVKDSITELTNPPYIYFASKAESIISAGHDIIYTDEVKKKISKLVHNFVDSSEKVNRGLLLSLLLLLLYLIFGKKLFSL